MYRGLWGLSTLPAPVAAHGVRSGRNTKSLIILLEEVYQDVTGLRQHTLDAQPALQCGRVARTQRLPLLTLAADVEAQSLKRTGQAAHVGAQVQTSAVMVALYLAVHCCQRPVPQRSDTLTQTSLNRLADIRGGVAV